MVCWLSIDSCVCINLGFPTTHQNKLCVNFCDLCLLDLSLLTIWSLKIAGVSSTRDQRDQKPLWKAFLFNYISWMSRTTASGCRQLVLYSLSVSLWCLRDRNVVKFKRYFSAHFIFAYFLLIDTCTTTHFSITLFLCAMTKWASRIT